MSRMNEQALRANPYVGLRPFFASDALYFFGREQQITELLKILEQHRFLGVVGSSGSGKSSLVRAGLVPALLGGFLAQERDRWRRVQIKPGDAPMSNLASGLLEALGLEASPEAVRTLEKEIRDGHTEAVLDFIAPRLEGNANLFVLVDQFEELFAFRGIDSEDDPSCGASNDRQPRRLERARRRAEASDFVDLLLALAEQRTLPIYVSLTMRTDFLGDCDVFYGLPEALNRGRYLVPRMTRQQLREAVECPAMLPGAQVAPRLIDHLLNELGDRFDQLPVLQHALLRTWDQWKLASGEGASAGPIDLQHYEEAGGLENALDLDAEAALDGLDLHITERMFKRLTDTDLSQRRVRSPARMNELATAAGTDRATVEQIVRRFEEGGRSFVHASDDGQPDDPRVDISHESLIRQWNRLRLWVDEERRSRDQYWELVARARKNEAGQAPLLEDPELQMALDWRVDAMPSAGWAARYASVDSDYEVATHYLDASVKVRSQAVAEAELKRRWKKIWGPVILLAVIVAAAVFTGERANFQLDNAMARLPQFVQDWVNKDPSQFRFAVAAWFQRAMNVSMLGLFVLAYAGLAHVGKKVHRARDYGRIEQDIAAHGGRLPDAQAIEAASTQDAVTLHSTTYASASRRTAGYLIDWVCFVPFIILVVVIMGLSGAFDGPSDEVSDATAATLFGLWLVAAWLYAAFQLSSKHKATWGMRAVGIFRTDLQGQRVSFIRASGWYAARMLSFVVYGMGFFCQPFTKKKQTLHDLLARSVVLRKPAATQQLTPVP